jgi:hypothetical protein
MEKHVPYHPGMTLLPGQSTSVEIPIPPEIAAQLRDGHFEEVPPPAAAPVQPRAKELGLLDGLHAHETDHPYRCGWCSQMQPSGSLQVWVPDGVRRGDPSWSVKEAARRGAYNGHSTAWCLKCARKLGGERRERHQASDAGIIIVAVCSATVAAMIAIALVLAHA